jgi:hypothetical protein
MTKSGRAKAPRSSSKASPPRTELVDVYVNRLKAAGSQKQAFDKVVADLQADKEARKVERLSIAKRYVGARLSAKANPLTEIKRRFVEQARFDRTLEIASQGTPS